jgi:hypothetical protein
VLTATSTFERLPGEPSGAEAAGEDAMGGEVEGGAAGESGDTDVLEEPLPVAEEQTDSEEQV